MPPTPPLPQLQAFKSLAAPKPLSASVVAPPPDYSQQISVGWNDETNADGSCAVDGYALYLGQRSRVYTTRIDLPWCATNTASFSWDNRQPLFCAITAYYNRPVTNCCSFTNAITNWTRCVTNPVIESVYSDELSVIFSNVAPFISVASGVSTLTGYGAAGSNYLVFESTDLGKANAWLLATNISGTNGAWSYSEPVQSQMFYSNGVTAAPLTNQ
jgi:hypothetical protein